MKQLHQRLKLNAFNAWWWIITVTKHTEPIISWKIKSHIVAQRPAIPLEHCSVGFTHVFTLVSPYFIRKSNCWCAITACSPFYYLIPNYWLTKLNNRKMCVNASQQLDPTLWGSIWLIFIILFLYKIFPR